MALRSAASVAVALVCILDGQSVAAAPKTHTVVIEGMRFNPDTLMVKRGDRIVFRNEDLVPHTATAGGTFDSRSIAAGGTWVYKATKAGVIAYQCTFHPGMNGTVTVQ